MSKAIALSSQDAQHKARALEYLDEARRIIRQLSTERRREERHRTQSPNILTEVENILHGNQ